ncbi:hypothetical protein GCM10010994_41920 [Chelatococcus reniformis]|uniref:Uncharacterized protein n=1 Tax=Chelatococcus reniformis TaxID=1494448 RepID=A0A916UMZ2_9HYPH|nr:hypothetical protein GCM10010994_41920 [Chelatococcus reniformis]
MCGRPQFDNANRPVMLPVGCDRPNGRRPASDGAGTAQIAWTDARPPIEVNT